MTIQSGTLRYRILICTAPLWLAACAAVQPAQPVPELGSLAPAAWAAPLPHEGKLADLRQWWQNQGDALLVELIDAAQAASGSLASAKSRIEQSRAALTLAGAALGPTLDAQASASRGVTLVNTPVATSLTAGLMAGWEVDLFGANRAAQSAAQERLASAQAQWHQARVSVAAEVANQYTLLRACLTQLELTQVDAASRSESARLTALTTRAGFTANGPLELTRASAADAANSVTQQRALCDVMHKGLVALTAMPEPELRSKIATMPTQQAQPAPVFIASVPAETLAQRPDLAAAARDVAAASQDLGSSQAQRYPRLSLSGSIGAMRVDAAGFNSDFATWSIGPVTLSVPLFDGGRRAANVDAAKARYEEAVAQYRAKARQAVREVEEALVNLQATSDRRDNAQIAALGYRASQKAVEQRLQAGFASQSELEDARRIALGADVAQLGLQRDRQLAWVALYRAVGGGWQATP